MCCNDDVRNNIRLFTLDCSETNNFRRDYKVKETLFAVGSGKLRPTLQLIDATINSNEHVLLYE